MEEDISVAGPGSPVSLKKVLASPTIELKDFNVFVTNDTYIVKDDPEVLYITSDDCKEQSLYFLNTLFDGKRFPHYCFHHMLFMFGSDAGSHKHDVYKKYPDSKVVKNAVLSGALTETDKDYQFVQNLFIYGKDNLEFLQVLGLIQLIAGSINSGVSRIYIEHPETHLHPKRQSAFISMFNNIKAEYTPPPPAPTRYNPETASLELDTDEKT